MVDVEQLANDGKLFDGRYKLLKTLSTDGGTADVWLAIDINTIDDPDLLGENRDDFSPDESGMLVAIKIYRPKNALDIEGEQRFRDEYKIVHNCRHTNLLQPTNFSIFEDTPYLELPYCKNGSSELLIGQFVEEKDIWKFIFDVSSGLSYLHACTPQIIHQDIKPANVLIDDYNNYAITDFGISSQCGGKHGFYCDEDHSGTMAYMAPERFGEDYKPIAESDIWAFGATLYEILTGEVPFNEGGGRNQLENKMRLKSMGSKISKDVQKLVTSCLSLNPKDRPTANEIIRISEKHLDKSNGFIKYTLAAVVLAFVVWVLIPNPTPEPVSIEETYQSALNLLDSDNPNMVTEGVNIMDSLSKQKYAPAMYQLARTYGWYNDSVSLKRKKALDIDYYAPDDKFKGGMPKMHKYNAKAMEIYSNILELEDISYDSIKANAAYRLAMYYANDNEIFKEDYGRAKEYILIAKEYAVKSNQDSLMNNINEGLKKLEKQMKK